MKEAFTMIELIFVIVLIGILAAISIPKLSATRDDAETSRMLTQLAACINHAGAAYTAYGIMDIETPNCRKTQKCFDLEFGNGDDTNGTLIVKSGSSVSASEKGEKYCIEAHRVADRQALSSPSGKEHNFGGSHVVYDF